MGSVPDLEEILNLYIDSEDDEKFSEVLDSIFDGVKEPETVPGVKIQIREGWYQDRKGLLYHYDGVVWDAVPYENAEELEYLG